MASRSDIEAGRSHVKLYVQDSQFMRGLSRATAMLRSFGQGIATMGRMMFGIGTAALAGIGGAVRHFVNFGSEMNDMAARTGLAREQLVALKYAAEQGGASMEDLETAIKRSQKEGKDFFKIADAIAATNDPARRTQMALDAWGKSGTKLLPIVNDLRAKMQEANDKGLVPMESSMRIADELGDRFATIWEQIKAVVFEVGAAVAPLLAPVAKFIGDALAKVIHWVRNNQDLIRSWTIILASVTAAAGAIVAIANPIGQLVIAAAAIGAGIATWVKHTEMGRAAFARVMTVVDDIRATLGAIGDALIAGDLDGAANVISLAAQIAFHNLWTAIISGWVTARNAVLDGWDFLREEFAAGAAYIASIWDSFAAGFYKKFRPQIDAGIKAWHSFGDAGESIFRGLATHGNMLVRVLNKVMEALGKGVTVALRLGPKLAKKGLDTLPRFAEETTGFDAKKAMEEADAAAAKAREEFEPTDRSELDDADEKARDKRDEALRLLEEELARLREELAKNREEALKNLAGGDKGSIKGEELPSRTFATFSASALMANVGGAQTPEQRAADALDVLKGDVKFLVGVGKGMLDVFKRLKVPGLAP